MAFLSKFELHSLGLKSYGKNVSISDKASFYGNSDIEIGNNVRIDDFCILSGKIRLGNNIHIGAYCALYGKFGIVMEDYTGLSPRCTIFSASDDFSGNFLISPMNPEKYTKVTGGEIRLMEFVQIGAGTVIMPGVTLHRGSSAGAMSFVKKSIPLLEIWAGNPLKYIKDRSSRMMILAQKLENEL